jgi:hypothetical protein
MQGLNPGDKLISQQECGFKREFSSAVIKQVLKTGSKHLDYHNVIAFHLTIPNELWETLFF